MWELKAIEIGSKKVDAQVNIKENNVEIEVPYYKSFKETDVIKIDKQTYTIFSASNIGGRDELLAISTTTEINNEHSNKQATSRKTTDI
tara:strand:- start:228 stop:494 length:267 start_codon:yes stop_codon:yes gene_type:complete